MVTEASEWPVGEYCGMNRVPMYMYRSHEQVDGVVGILQCARQCAVPGGCKACAYINSTLCTHSEQQLLQQYLANKHRLLTRA